jgi:hypothetical protein
MDIAVLILVQVFENYERILGGDLNLELLEAKEEVASAYFPILLSYF